MELLGTSTRLSMFKLLLVPYRPKLIHKDSRLLQGIYPTVVLVLVSQKRSLKEGAFSTAGNATAGVITRIETMNFGTNPAVEGSAIFHDDGGSSDEEFGDSAESRSEAEREVYSDRSKEKSIV